ncbi:MAG: TIGR04255 family protein [Deltaproteobacteria bacterium]|nr:TIGR04255 family protein [Deltaproteobacteria bacterium]
MSYPSYKTPPIVEAVIELRFATTIASRPFAEALRHKLGAAFQEKLEEHEAIELSAEVGHSSIAAAARREARAWFIRRHDEQIVVGCSPGVLSVHALAPYGGWDQTLLPQARRVVELLTDDERAHALRAVGVRYVDRIVLPQSDWTLDDYFPLLPRVPASMPASLAGLRWSVATSKEALSVTLTVASAPPEENGAAVVIYDLALLQQLDDPSLSSERWVAALQEMHVLQRKIFEESITDKTRELFQ